MSLAHQPPEQRLVVAFARTLLVILTITFLAWAFSRPEPGAGACTGPQPADGADASAP